VLYALPTYLTSGATPDACWRACSVVVSPAAPFYFSITGAGACLCSKSNALVYDPTSTVRGQERQWRAIDCMASASLTDTHTPHPTPPHQTYAGSRAPINFVREAGLSWVMEGHVSHIGAELQDAST
jgi:hypothetical protein